MRPISCTHSRADHDPQISDRDLQDVQAIVSINNGVATVDNVKVCVLRSVLHRHAHSSKATTEWRRSLVKRAVLSTVDGLGLSLANQILLYFAHL